MTPEALTQYLHTTIPLSRAMEVSAVRASASNVVLVAPLLPNINMHGTLFGGSGATLCLLAAWSAVHLRLERDQFETELVIHTSQMEYIAPAREAISAHSAIDDGPWERTATMLAKRGRGRITVSAQLFSGETLAARFVGEFVATTYERLRNDQ
ncbi:YiiD C-terminal domain-containing protein [Devosia sp. MC1541]|uniref:YiiD C-terminal domain-containing protein n=1 Tax=Devosia sp. MC1541 TaxID=2725264 RepID=UPI00145E5925|nr:YiiD C-terminal domain-containing protein [Devosia sp. MC1541]